MNSEKALSLVISYAQLNKSIKKITKEIAETLEKCHGINGDRKSSNYIPKYNEKGKELGLHLTQWYTPISDYEGHAEWLDVDYFEQGEECPYCYHAHALIQKRKDLKVAFGNIKRAISNINLSSE